MPIEIWKPIPDYEGLYEISDAGNVRNVATGQILRGDICKGYRRIGLYRNGHHKRIGVHRLVLLTFIGLPPTPERNKSNHRNGVRLDNRPDNLEWVTPSQNSLHRCRVLKTHRQKGSQHGRHKLDEANVVDIIKRTSAGEMLATIAKDFNVCISTVSQIAHGKIWKHVERPPRLFEDRRLIQGVLQLRNHLSIENLP